MYVEITNKELAYLKLYKGKDEGIKYLYPDAEEEMYWYYAIDYNYNNINSLINFVFTKNPNLLKNLSVWRLDEMLDMVFTLSDFACRFAIENPREFGNLYRMEHKDNLNNYAADGMMTSFKSTSKSNSEVTVFEDNNSVGLKFETEGFIPYIDIDKIVKGTVFADEKEIIFPPCIQGNITGEKVNYYNNDFICVKLQDDFEMESYNCENSKALYEQIKTDFVNEMTKAIKTGDVSPKLNEYCQIVSTYIYQTLRHMYNNYYKIYQNDKIQGFSR